MFWFPGGGGRPALLRATIKAVAAIGFLSYSAAVWFSSQSLDRGALARLATNTTGSDPVVTGSLADTAKGTRLDPCVRQRRL